MNHLSTLPSTAEQARHALLLLGAPAPARLLVEVHGALFDGDLSMAAVAALVRDRTSGLAAALRPDLTAAPGLVALAEWPVERRLVTPAHRRADELTMVLRVAEFVTGTPVPGRAAAGLVRELAVGVPHGVEALDLTEAARVALDELAPELEAERPLRQALAARAAELDPRQQRYGIPAVPHQRGES